MTTGKSFLSFVFLLFVLNTTTSNVYSQKNNSGSTVFSPIASEVRLTKLLESPLRLNGYFPDQNGFLGKPDANGNMVKDTTFTVEKSIIPSEGFQITGWLYIPKQPGKFSLLILANGGSGKSLSEWIAPILAHCGIAAFVHDKRATGESEGNINTTTYDDYVSDIGNIAKTLSEHPQINPDKIGVFGGSEGGRMAYLAAARFPLIKIAASYAGDVTSTYDSRMFTTTNWLKSKNISDSVLTKVLPLWEKSFDAWINNNAEDHEHVNQEILDYRKHFGQDILPFLKEEVDSIYTGLLPTWNSMKNDYLTELGQFRKPWLTIFGGLDVVVPTHICIKNIIHYMKQSGNRDYEIFILPKCGHAPVDNITRQLVRIDHILINWLKEKDF